MAKDAEEWELVRIGGPFGLSQLCVQFGNHRPVGDCYSLWLEPVGRCPRRRGYEGLLLFFGPEWIDLTRSRFLRTQFDPSNGDGRELPKRIVHDLLLRGRTSSQQG